jgi:hypothetical protein
MSLPGNAGDNSTRQTGGRSVIVEEKRKERRGPGGGEGKGEEEEEAEAEAEEKKPNWREKVWSCEKRKVSGLTGDYDLPRITYTEAD